MNLVTSWILGQREDALAVVDKNLDQHLQLVDWVRFLPRALSALLRLLLDHCQVAFALFLSVILVLAVGLRRRASVAFEFLVFFALPFALTDFVFFRPGGRDLGPLARELSSHVVALFG